ncbi:MAG TPA: hypothetical protein VFX53_17170 [Pedococcus sp.]|nr:hypothetical protein [Pedococcus sp.]
MPDPNLTARAESLSRSVGNLAESVQALTVSQAHIKRVMTATVVGLILVLVLAVVSVFLIANQRAVNARLSEVQDRTSNQVLCPLYETFRTLENRAVTSTQITEEERQQRREAYAVINQGYAALGCRPQ